MKKKDQVPIRRVIVIPDTQLPFEDKRAIDAVEQYMADHTWSEWIHIGDLMDFNYISKWTVNNLKVITGTTFTDDYAYANEFLDRQQKIIRKNNPDAKFTLIEGNHDYRPEKVIEKDPRYEGLIEVEKNLKLRSRGIKYIRFWSKGESYKTGNALFIHGRFTNQYHANKTAMRYGTNVFYGHTHDIQLHSLVHLSGGKAIVGQSLGCLCRYDMPFMQGTPSNWQQGFGVFHFFPNGDFNYYVPRIFNGRFISPEGKIYEGKI